MNKDEKKKLQKHFYNDFSKEKNKFVFFVTLTIVLGFFSFVLGIVTTFQNPILYVSIPCSTISFVILIAKVFNFITSKKELSLKLEAIDIVEEKLRDGWTIKETLENAVIVAKGSNSGISEKMLQVAKVCNILSSYRLFATDKIF